MTREEKISEYRKKHFGESAVANCGMKMFIIAYRGTDDIDVVFQDGTIVTNKRYKNFTKCKIANPNIGLGLNICDRIGEVKASSRGGKMILIKYLNANKITVQFESGEVIANRTYQNFCQGYITRPTNKVGEESTASNGQVMTIIKYRKSNDIDVQFEDGTIITGIKYDLFLKGLVKNPNNPFQRTISKVGEVCLANCGQKMTIITYRNYSDIDVQFEDGIIIEHKHYDCFQRGYIAHPLHSTKKNTKKKKKQPCECMVA